MKRAIGDEAAIKFAVGFYDALGAGRDFESAFKFGCSAIAWKGIPADHANLEEADQRFPSSSKTAARRQETLNFRAGGK